MKKWLAILLVLSLSVSAATFYRGDYAKGLLPDGSKIVCDPQSRTGIAHLNREKACCLKDLDSPEPRCYKDDKPVGECDRGVCFWPDVSYTATYRDKLMTHNSCEEGSFTVIAGKDYRDKLSECSLIKEDDLKLQVCCPTTVFVNTPGVIVSGPELPEQEFGNPIMVVNKNKWELAKKGYFRGDMYLTAAVTHETNRCKNDPREVRIIDPEISSFFKDARNMHPGQRVFMFTDDSIYTLISWCDQ